jgi:rubrerythrin
MPIGPISNIIPKNFEKIRCEDLTQWLEAQEQRWRCKNCGAAHSWYHETCPQCDQAVASYKA